MTDYIYGDYRNSKLASEIYDALILSKPIQVDATDPDNIYLGYAALGTATSSPAWFMQKIVVNGELISTLTANGSDKYNNIWNDRASLSYS